MNNILHNYRGQYERFFLSAVLNMDLHGMICVILEVQVDIGYRYTILRGIEGGKVCYTLHQIIIQMHGEIGEVVAWLKSKIESNA